MFWKFGDFLNLDPDWTNFVDPDPDPHHWFLRKEIPVSYLNKLRKEGAFFKQH